MKSMRKKLSFARRPNAANVTIRPSASAHPWEEDRENVLNMGASFIVKYLESVDVPEARGVHVCENAVKSVPYRHGKKKMTLTISKAGIRIVDNATQMLAVDQPINKISFCSPDPFNPRIFSYIARDGATRRWMCHIFVAKKGQSGERLSHALGCAFAACLRDKEKREEEDRLKGKKKKKPDAHTGNTEAQLGKGAKDAAPPLPAEVELLRQKRQKMEQQQQHSSQSSPSSIVSSALNGHNGSAAEEKSDTISFEEELDNIINSHGQGTASGSSSPTFNVDLQRSVSDMGNDIDFETPKLASWSREVSGGAIGLAEMTTIRPEKNAMQRQNKSAVELLSFTKQQSSSSTQGVSEASSSKASSTKRWSVSVVPSNDPWQSAAKQKTVSEAVNVPSNPVIGSTSSGSHQPKGEHSAIVAPVRLDVVNRDPWAPSTVKKAARLSAAAVDAPANGNTELINESVTQSPLARATAISTNPFVSDIVSPTSSIASTVPHHSSAAPPLDATRTLMQLLDPLSSGYSDEPLAQAPGTGPVVGSSDTAMVNASSGISYDSIQDFERVHEQPPANTNEPQLFGDWGTAVKQMHQLPNHSLSVQRHPWGYQASGNPYTNPWMRPASQQQHGTRADVFNPPSLI